MAEHKVNLKIGPKLKPVLAGQDYQPNPKFGTVFSPHLLRMTFATGDTEFNAEIVPLQGESFMPGTLVLHYGQSIFEGLKAYRLPNGEVGAFRADLHAERFRKSGERMAMAPLPEDVFLKCIKAFIRHEAESVPSLEGHSLYLRPLQFASDVQVKLGPSKTYKFYVMATMAGNYFSTGEIQPAQVLVNPQYVRAFPNGTGEAKTAGNYAASLMPQAQAIQYGCDQVLYLDAVHHDNVDELGGMNFFAVRNGQLITPKLTGAILRGVTRRSILELAAQLGIPASEDTISFRKLIDEIRSGKVTECFACGTAAVVHPIGTFVLQEGVSQPHDKVVLPKEFPIARKILKTLSSVQRGQEPAPGNWIFRG